MGVDDCYQQFREENRRQFNEQRQATDQWIDVLRMSTDQWIDSWRLKTEAFVKSQEEARAETRHNFEFLAELIRGVAGKESTPTPTNQETTPMSNPVPNPPAQAPTTTNLQNSASTAPNPPTLVPIASDGLGAGSKEQSATVNLSQGCNDPTISWGISIKGGQEINVEVPSEFLSSQQLEGEALRPELHEILEKLQSHFEFSKVISNFPNIGKINVASYEKLVVDDVHLANRVNIEVMEKSMTEFEANLTGFPKISNAYKVFVKMPRRRMSDELVLTVVEGRGRSHPIIFYPGGGNNHGCLSVVQETGYRNELFGFILDEHLAWDSSIMGRSLSDQEIDLTLLKNGLKSLPFDRGIASIDVIDIQLSRAMAFVFDPRRASVVQTVEQRMKMMRMSSKSALNHSL